MIKMYNSDIRNLIALYLNDQDLIHFISVNKSWQMNYDKKFWVDLFQIRRYPIFKMVNTTDEWLLLFKQYGETYDFTTDMLNKSTIYSDVIIELNSISSLICLNIIPEYMLLLSEKENSFNIYKDEQNIIVYFYTNYVIDNQYKITINQFMTIMYYICTNDIYSCHYIC